jgi:hypothetical protein
MPQHGCTGETGLQTARQDVETLNSYYQESHSSARQNREVAELASMSTGLRMLP